MILFSDLLSCSQIMRHQFSDGPAKAEQSKMTLTFMTVSLGWAL